MKIIHNLIRIMLVIIEVSDLCIQGINQGLPGWSIGVPSLTTLHSLFE